MVRSGFFRSERMSLCQMLLHKESAFDCLIELGKIGLVQFNSPTEGEPIANLKFTNEIQRCNEILRITQRLQKDVDEYGIETPFDIKAEEDDVPRIQDMKEIEQRLQELDKDLQEMEQSYEALNRQKLALEEKLLVLEIADTFLTGAKNTEAVMAWSDSVIMHLMRDDVRRKKVKKDDPSLRLGYFAGSIPYDRFHAFEMMLWRVCHYNFYLKYAPIMETLTDPQNPQNRVRKQAFMVYFIGEAMREKIAKVCQGFRANLYECPESINERNELRETTALEVEDLKVVLNKTDDERRRILAFTASDLFHWRVKAKRMLAVYHVLNKLGSVTGASSQRYLEAECWIPSRDVPEVRRALLRGAGRASRGGGLMFPPILIRKPNVNRLMPPTHFRLNKFTRGFQNLIDAYGIASYQEVNPAPYTIITFPFLFAVMFGDIGHGIIMAIFAALLIIKEKKIEYNQRMAKSENEIANILFAGRYIILLMGVFSIYTGFIYNDIFSKAVNIFGSRWRVNYNEADVKANEAIQLDPKLKEFYLGTPYWFGVDPVWMASGENAITTFNSLKMKIAIVMGVMQMMFGLALSAWNAVYFRDFVDLVLVVIPQTIFLIALFGYLAILIFFKWANYGGHYTDTQGSACAPSILINFINMVLMRGAPEVPEGCKEDMYKGQQGLQIALVVIALLCVPVLLAGKPLHLTWQKRKLKKIKDQAKKKDLQRLTDSSVRKSLLYNVDSRQENLHHFEATEKTSHDTSLGEVWIHSGIHCIESVLGTVSHTASYLRLWALSLAHAQLSHVLWLMVLSLGFAKEATFTKIPMLFLAFYFWAILTIAILIVMEALSAFLHTLRLHWVEFQSKFYMGAGEVFVPFRFKPTTATD